MKPYIHAVSSATKFGGKLEDYLKIHDWFDQTKSHLGDNRHRAILHSSFGIFLAEQVFGHNIVNSDCKQVSVRDIGEQHVIEDMGAIPTVADYLSELPYQDWMHGKGLPPSYRKVEEYEKATKAKQTIVTIPKEYHIIPTKEDTNSGIVNFPLLDGSYLFNLTDRTIVDGADGKCANILRTPPIPKSPTLYD